MAQANAAPAKLSTQPAATPARTVPALSPVAAAAVVPAPVEAPAPIRLSVDHAKILSPTSKDGRPLTIPELHMQLSTETKDLNWAVEMEQHLSQFIAQVNITSEFEVLGIECRATLCEILAFGNLPSSSERWSVIGSEMTKQAWWSNFQGNSTLSSGQNGRTTIVTILQRAKR